MNCWVYFFVIVVYHCIPSYAQDIFSIRAQDRLLTFSGYLKAELFADSRQIIGLREDHLSFIPFPKELDTQGSDINDRGQLHMVALETRIRADLTETKINDVRYSGAIEVDFIGPFVVDSGTQVQLGTASAVNGIRMRHAYIQCDWDYWTIIAGQYWHPLVPPEHAAKYSITFQTAPFEGIARQPQIRCTWRPRERLELAGILSSQLDFRSNGPKGFSTQYARNAIMPNISAQVRYVTEKYIFGGTIDFKRLVPHLSTTGSAGTFSTREGVNSFSAIVFNVIESERYYWFNKFTYGENLTEQLLFSGYAVTTRDPVTGKETFTPTRNIAFITDIHRKGTLEPGLIVGFSKNIATRKNLFIDTTKTGNDRFTIFGRGGGGEDNMLPQFLNAVDYIIGIQPRLRWYFDHLVVGAEIEYLRASYGQLTQKGRVTNGVPVNNVRFIAALWYNF